MYYDKEGKEITLDKYALLHADRGYTVVEQTQVKKGVRRGMLSTVWLGLDHGYQGDQPVIFETMFFPDEESPESHDSYFDRYTNEPDAWFGHQWNLLRLEMNGWKVLAIILS